MNNNIIQGKKEIFSLLRESLIRNGITYVKDFGFRVFYKNGKSFGICSHHNWSERKKKDDFKLLASEFYSQELIKLKRFNRNYEVRAYQYKDHIFYKELVMTPRR